VTRCSPFHSRDITSPRSRHACNCKPVVGSGHAAKQRADAGERGVHQAGPERDCAFFEAVCGTQHAAQEHPFPFGNVDAELLHQPHGTEPEPGPAQGAGTGKSRATPSFWQESQQYDRKEEVTMPRKATIERAKEDAREGKAPSTQAGEFVREEIHHVVRESTAHAPPSKPSRSDCRKRARLGLLCRRNLARREQQRAARVGNENVAARRPRSVRGRRCPRSRRSRNHRCLMRPWRGRLTKAPSRADLPVCTQRQ